MSSSMIKLVNKKKDILENSNLLIMTTKYTFNLNLKPYYFHIRWAYCMYDYWWHMFGNYVIE